jgi:hypothetical protein
MQSAVNCFSHLKSSGLKISSYCLLNEAITYSDTLQNIFGMYISAQMINNAL